MPQTFKQIQQFDAQRPGVPGEHWATLAAGLGLWRATRRRGPIGRLIGLAGAAALVLRAFSGRDALARRRR